MPTAYQTNAFLCRICPNIKEGSISFRLQGLWNAAHERVRAAGFVLYLCSNTLNDLSFTQRSLHDPFTDPPRVRLRAQHAVSLSSRIGQNHSVDVQLFISVSVFVCECECVRLWCRAAMWAFSQARRSVYVCVCVKACSSLHSLTCLCNLCLLISAVEWCILYYLVSAEKHSPNIWFIHVGLFNFLAELTFYSQPHLNLGC